MKSNPTVVGLAAVLVSLCAPLAGFAVCPASAFNPNLVPDGTLIMETIPASGGRIYVAELTAGRSYSLQVTSPEQNGATLAYTLEPTGTLFGGVATTTDTTTTDPQIVEVEFMGAHDHGGRRISILVSSSGHFIFTFCNSDSVLGHALTIALVETTLFGAPYFTAFDFDTFITLQNTTNLAANATVRFIDVSNPATVFSTNVGVPANGSAVISTRAVVPVASST